jgi:hypothetical protein
VPTLALAGWLEAAGLDAEALSHPVVEHGFGARSLLTLALFLVLSENVSDALAVDWTVVGGRSCCASLGVTDRFVQRGDHGLLALLQR